MEKPVLLTFREEFSSLMSASAATRPIDRRRRRRYLRSLQTTRPYDTHVHIQRSRVEWGSLGIKVFVLSLSPLSPPVRICHLCHTHIHTISTVVAWLVPVHRGQYRSYVCKLQKDRGRQHFSQEWKTSRLLKHMTSQLESKSRCACSSDRNKAVLLS